MSAEFYEELFNEYDEWEEVVELEKEMVGYNE